MTDEKGCSYGVCGNAFRALFCEWPLTLNAARPSLLCLPSSDLCPLPWACLAVTYSSTAWAAVPSALARFTAEFGMGSGGDTPQRTTRQTQDSDRRSVIGGQ